jgi:hypothetical protein
MTRFRKDHETMKALKILSNAISSSILSSIKSEFFPFPFLFPFPLEVRVGRLELEREEADSVYAVWLNFVGLEGWRVLVRVRLSRLRGEMVREEVEEMGLEEVEGAIRRYV